MTLPSTGSISTDQIKTEIGVTGAITIPDANTRTLTGKSTGALIIPTDFYGKTWGSGSSPAASLSAHSLTAIHTSGGTATCTFKLGADGNAYQVINGAQSTLEVWLDSGTNANFQVRATLSSGTAPSGTFGTWSATTTDNSWTLSKSGATGAVTDSILIEIRDSSTLTVLTSATISLDAEIG